MSAQEELQQADESAVNETQAEGASHIVNLAGEEDNRGASVAGKGSIGGMRKKLPAVLAIVIIMVILIVVLFVGGNTVIDWVLTRTVEETDVQYADATQSMELVFQHAMEIGEVPENTSKRLEQSGVTVGYMDGDTFVASNTVPAVLAKAEDIYTDTDTAIDGIPSNTVDRLKQTGITIEGGSGGLVLRMDDGTIITADNFYDEIQHNVELYDAFKSATYGRSAYFYDEKAQQVFKKIGTSRNNFTGDKTVEETMNKLMGNKNTVGFQDRTWHYMPVWSLVYGNPNRISDETYISGWIKVVDEFRCTGTNVTQIDTWRVVKVETRIEYDYDDEGNIIDEYIEYYIPDNPEYIYSNNGDYGCNGADTESYMTAMTQANMSEDNDEQTIKNTTDSLKAADTISKEQKSMLLYSGFMESISRVKAGYGKANTETDKIIAAFGTMGATYGESHINDVMNTLFERKTSKVVDVNTGQEVELTGSMLEAPSLYAMLAGEEIKAEDVENFSSDRILETMKNNTNYEVDNNTILRTATTKGNDNQSAIGRYTNNSRNYTPRNRKLNTAKDENYNWGDYEDDNIGLVELTIKNSLYSSYDEINGILAGEMLAEGAVNVGKELAKASGAAAGDEEAVTAYLKLNSDVLAMDAAADRLHRSPLDITSKNTFLGSIMYKFAVASVKSNGIMGRIASISRVTNSTIASILPSAHAEDTADGYLSTFGECQTLNKIGAKGSATCSMIATFDTDTYQENNKSIYESSEFRNFVEKNTKCTGSGENQVCEINDTAGIKSVSLAKYVGFNENRNTPIGLTDGTIVEHQDDYKSVLGKAFSKITSLFRKLLDIDNGLVPPEATGESFVDKEDNKNWDGGAQYKYAQRYISLARAAETMRQYDGDESAYVFDGFGTGDPVARYIDKLNQDSIALVDE